MDQLTLHYFAELEETFIVYNLANTTVVALEVPTADMQDSEMMIVAMYAGVYNKSLVDKLIHAELIGDDQEADKELEFYKNYTFEQ